MFDKLIGKLLVSSTSSLLE